MKNSQPQLVSPKDEQFQRHHSKGVLKGRPPFNHNSSNNQSFRLSHQNSQSSLNINGQQKENIQEVLSHASEKKFGLGGRIISSLNLNSRKPPRGGEVNQFMLAQSRNNSIS